MFYYGEGVKQDYLQAKELFDLAAKQGHPVAQYMLEIMFYEGKGTIAE
jgi:hypothetical protein